MLEELKKAGLEEAAALQMARLLAGLEEISEPARRWQRISREVLKVEHPFPVHQLLFRWNYRGWDASRGPAPAWIPDAREIEASNAFRLQRSLELPDWGQLYDWSIRERAAFWGRMAQILEIRFHRPPEAVLDPTSPMHTARWFPGARLNIAASCFSGPRERPAVIEFRNGHRRSATLGELEALSMRVARGLADKWLVPGDRVAVILPLTLESVAAYLGIILAGCVAVSIPVSLATEEIAARLRMTPCRAVFTQDVIPHRAERLPMFEKVAAAGAPPVVVLPYEDSRTQHLRRGDLSWGEFLGRADGFDPVPRDPGDHLNILFSSGTSGEPKAIPWTHTTPIKSAADGHLHQDLHPEDVLAWPTNLGWMMGPWLIFAGLINRCTLALYDGPPSEPGFCRFVRDAGVTVLGVVPSLVRAWRAGGCLEGVDWSRIRLFSSTGECSNEEDMLWLMSRAGYRPVIEYCGGTELGGGYLSGTMVRPAAPAAFSTPTLGSEVAIRDDTGAESAGGELFLVPPTIGFSTELLQGDHQRIYYPGMPPGPGGLPLRRHGDAVERLPGGYFKAHGRVDDTMNLGGIKVSSVELERTVARLDWVAACAAIAAAPAGGGPSELVFFVVPRAQAPLRPEEMQAAMQEAIRRTLNPLFKIREVVPVPGLPQTASNKIMRRTLRDLYAARGTQAGATSAAASTWAAGGPHLHDPLPSPPRESGQA